MCVGLCVLPSQGIVAADTAEVTDEEGFFNPSRSVRPMHYNMSCHVMYSHRHTYFCFGRYI